jgi:hypothetical protein
MGILKNLEVIFKLQSGLKINFLARAPPDGPELHFSPASPVSGIGRVNSCVWLDLWDNSLPFPKTSKVIQKPFGYLYLDPVTFPWIPEYP